ncbi:MAG: glucan 1,4-alpha-glucosidase [Bacteroidota bacterium]|nr:glucan 1,4-alpha-glucosidase [Bacteroidota bacterium]
MNSNENFAPGWPGIQARWTSSAKNGIGTALSAKSHVWFTHSHGILNEIYYPEVDRACTRDFGLLITDGQDFFSEEKRHTQTLIEHLTPGVPAYHLVNTCLLGRYRIEKDIIADPDRDVVLQQIRFVPLKGSLADYHLYVLLAPHLGNHGSGNTAWVGDRDRVPMMFAERDGNALALACSVPWIKMSVGFVGISDGWQDVMQHKQMQWEYSRAENGNVAIIGEIDLQISQGVFVLAIGFGQKPADAAEQAKISLQQNFETVLFKYTKEWSTWEKNLLPPPEELKDERGIYLHSMSVLRASESKLHPGAIIASLSIPWGFSKGDNDLGGYHLVWARDLVETAGALLAAGANNEVLRVIHYLVSTQLPDGHWPQNMWINGNQYWPGIQMDETAFPILLIDMAYRKGLLKLQDLKDLWPTVRKAARYLVMNGPVTQQDRWEEDPGYSPFTLAVEIAGLLSAADIADVNNEFILAKYLRETADFWNSSIERWTYVQDTELARENGVDGYYVRIAPPDAGDAASPDQGFVPIKNRPPGQSNEPETHIISPDALALVRFGIRPPDDPRIRNTVKIIDALLKIETDHGPVWHRYNYDGYGEHEDGSPFDGTGVGRAWPLLVGERAHYELAAGRLIEAKKLLKAMQSFANDGGMIPEQIWDSPDIPDRELFFGRPSGSAMPLVWAHAEYVKLVRSLHDGSVFDTPPQTVQRYIIQKIESPYAVWRFNHKCKHIPPNKILRIETLSSAIIRWSSDGWRTIQEIPTQDSGIGLHIVEIPTKTLSPEGKILFTFYWRGTAQWEGKDYSVQIEKYVSPSDNGS